MSPTYRFWAAALVISGALSAFHPNREADVFFHLELGRAVIAERARTVTEPYAIAGFEPTCMAPAWLWDVLAYALHAAGGFVALSLLTIASAVLAALGISAFARTAQRDAGFRAWAVVSAAALVCAAARFEMRPQTLAIALLAGYLALTARHVALNGRARAANGCALVGLALVWAQLHGSFVLAPVVFAIYAAVQRLEGGHAELDASALRIDLLVLGGTTAALGASAAGLDVLAYVGGHGYGDGVRFIHEMRPPSWAELVSFQGANGKALALLWLLCLFGLTRHGRWQWNAIALALVGHLLLSRAHRFQAEDALLCIPLALAGAANLADWAKRALSPRLAPALSGIPLLLALGLLAQAVLDNRGSYGAGFGLGVDETAFPRLAARQLARLPAGTPVLSSFGAGPPLAFWSERRLRTYVDGRTPLYFDDADYALERELMTNEQALERGLLRYGFRAAVIDRAHGVCDLLARRWHAVVVEAAYSTFVPPESGAALRGIDPCGPVYVHSAREAADPAALERSIAQLAKLGTSPFLEFLSAERTLLDPRPDAARALALLERSARPTYALPHRRARVAALLAGSQLDAAYALIREGLREGDVSLLQFVVRPEMGALDTRRARELLELAVSALGEAAGPPVRSLLAAICAEQGDAECARFHAMRAAARAAPNVEPTLQWLTKHAETERERADARAWLELLEAERRAALVQ